MAVNAAELLDGCFRRAFAPRERLLIDVWADRHRVIARKDAAEPGPWRTDRVPYMRRPLRMMAHPLVREVDLMTASHVAKTETVITAELYFLAEAPGPMLLMMPTVDASVGYNNDWFLPSLRATRPAAALLSGSGQDLRNRKTDLRNGQLIWWVGSNSEIDRRGKSGKYIVCDEIEAYPDPEWVEVFERVKARGDYKLIRTSTPGDERSGIHAFWLRGTRERYFVPCPHCGRYQRLRRGMPGRPGSLNWEGGGSATEEQAKSTAHYLCESKECVATGPAFGRVHDYHKPGMLRRGVWVPEGPDARPGDIAASLERDAEAEADPWGLEKRPAEHASFQIGSLYSPFPGATFGEMAKAFVRSRGRVTKKFVNGWDGEPWVVAGDTVAVAELKKLCAPLEADGGYRLGGPVPRQVLGLVCSVDVQKDRMYVVVRGWGERGIDSWLVDRQVLPRSEGRELQELDAWLGVSPGQRGYTRRYAVQGDPRRLRVNALGIDSGDFTVEVYQAVRRLREAGVLAFATKGSGDSARGMRVTEHLSHIDRWPDGAGAMAGKPMAPGCPLLTINSNAWKSRLVGRMKGRPEAEDLEGLAAGQVPGWYYPANELGSLDEYFQHVTAEHRVEDRGTEKKPRSLSYRWQLRDGQVDNHDFDCEYTGLCLAHVCKVRTLGVRAEARPERREEVAPAGGAERPRSPVAVPPWAR
jgi:phage terminase large subunit GpA-like protein